ncbi:unnamed protein product [Eruca vesicaria subsp. sativa]|uniref:Uncharacterized protein n=1 Tax=Eruca vesicaria subsp. sativa TaxID=29727 RepID=A0ABC8L5H3_ERUVS|nr:unnamed protein product [Eruca vesicaria subsp. sativa]
MECRLEKSFTSSSAKPLQTQVKQCMEAQAGGGVEHELVKYMSKLPVFLERAETTPQEKLLSVGVLDWSRLEKWHHSHNRMNQSLYASLVLPRDESSAGTSNVHKSIPSCPRKHRISTKKKPKGHRGFSVQDEQFAPKTEKKDVISKANISRSKKSEKKLRERISIEHDEEVGQKQQGETKFYHSTKKLSLEEAKTSKKSSTKKVQVVHGVEVVSSEKDTTTTSHLRRFLEPLLKPRATHSANLGITGCRTVNVNDSAHEKKVVRAVLQVTVRNNQPLFIFTVNKETNIIAATQKKIGSECISVYTFFSIKDHKRKSSWLSQRGRGQTHGIIISNVVAQMRVSSTLPSGSIREFVLFSVELDQESTDLQLRNELAAIIVKMPRWVKDHNALDKECEDHIKDISATVILQSGVHSMPHKGGPSSLIQRWRTGGSCDCEGWDIGCNLRVLTNQHSFSFKKSTTSNPFELFFLGEQAEEHPFLSYKPIKEGIYSVVYDSSLSQLQAFSICMALAESRKMSEFTLEHESSCDEHKSQSGNRVSPGPRFKT